MRSRRTTTIRDLQIAISCLPRHTRIAMLEGIRTNEIVVGAYSHDGGICPMLAAHRCGGRTNFISFARAWDRFALGARGSGVARRATPRELRILVTHLEASLLEEDAPRTELAAVIAEHASLRAQRLERERSAPAQRNEREPSAPARRLEENPSAGQRPGDPSRATELRHRPGWAWTRVVRRLDDYERALRWVKQHGQTAEEDSATREPALR